METTNHHPILGLINYVVTISSAMFSIITVQQVQPIVTLVSSLIAFVSGIFAIRYYHFATKKIKK